MTPAPPPRRRRARRRSARRRSLGSTATSSAPAAARTLASTCSRSTPSGCRDRRGGGGAVEDTDFEAVAHTHGRGVRSPTTRLGVAVHPPRRLVEPPRRLVPPPRRLEPPARRLRPRAPLGAAPPAPSIIGISSSGIIMSPDGLLGFDGSDGAFGPIFCSCPISSPKSRARAARAAGAAPDAAPAGAEHRREPLQHADMSGAAPPPGPGAAPGAPARRRPARRRRRRRRACPSSAARVVRVGRQRLGGRLLDLEERAPPGGICGRPAPDGRGRGSARRRGGARWPFFRPSRVGVARPPTCGCQNGIDGKAAAQTVLSTARAQQAR